MQKKDQGQGLPGLSLRLIFLLFLDILYLDMFKKILLLLLLVAALYGGGRLYFAVTGGFTMSNIESDIPYQAKWDTHPLSPTEKEQIASVLDQPFIYLGKGCQAYVFTSPDDKYVIKFFKYQRFRPQTWIDFFTFIPAVNEYQQHKVKEKQEKLDKVFTSWKIAFEDLKDETGVVYVHLNKSTDWKKFVTIRDKLGLEHQVDLDKTEFMVQHKAVMLCPAIRQLMEAKQLDQAILLIDKLLTMLLSEYARGYADNDHALMQNTGVLNGNPIHIDIGQFIRNGSVKAPKVYKQELYDKTYQFYLWLKGHYPSLAEHLRTRLIAIIGPDYFYSAPYVHKGDVAKIPHIEYTN